MIWIGIDPGTNTGIAIWNATTKRLVELSTLPIHQAMEIVRLWQQTCKMSKTELCVVFEDARKRSRNARDVKCEQAKQGAGSIKRDCAIWEDFLADLGISYVSRRPDAKLTKINPDYFKVITGVKGRTSNHARDAAMLVFGK